MRIHSRSERFIEKGGDHPTIDINVETDRMTVGGEPEVHYAAIQVHGGALCDLAEQVLSFCNVPISEYH